MTKVSLVTVDTKYTIPITKMESSQELIIKRSQGGYTQLPTDESTAVDELLTPSSASSPSSPNASERSWGEVLTCGVCGKFHNDAKNDEVIEGSWALLQDREIL